MNKRRILAWIMAICLIMSMPFSSMPSYAAQSNVPLHIKNDKVTAIAATGHEKYERSDVSYEDSFVGMKQDNGISPFAMTLTTSDTGLYESQLSGLTLEFYTAIKTAHLTSSKNAVQVMHSYNSGEDFDSVWAQARAVYSTAMWAYQRDHIDEFLWASNSVRIGISGNSVNCTLTLTYVLSDYYVDSYSSQYNSRVNSIIANCSGSNRYQKVKYYHDWLVNNNEYDSYALSVDETTERFYQAHGLLGCMLYGTGVCESYAKNFKVFCIKEGIPCLIVTSADHAWNYVKMEDGKWYMVDCTYDDPIGGNGRVYYDNFLVSNEVPQDSSHVLDHDFSYPTTSSVAFNSSHTFSITADVSSSCSTNGYITYSCSHCGISSKEYKELDDSNHESISLKNVVNATCGSAGYSGDRYCNSCQKKVSSGSDIPATGNHNYSIYTQKSTCSQNGYKTYTCTVCSASKKESLPLDSDNHVGQTEVRNQKSANCVEDGYTGDTYCKSCNQILESGTVIPATGEHDYYVVSSSVSTCYTRGQVKSYCRLCPAQEITVLPLDPNKHSGGTYLVGAKNVSCGSDGYTGDSYCKGCDELLVTGRAIPATGDHDWEYESTITEADCVTQGLDLYICGSCGATKTVATSKNPSKHTRQYALEAHKAATCGQAGYTGDTYCESCGVLLYKGSVVPATGDHKWNAGVVSKAATETSTGMKLYTCTVCSQTKTEVIPQLKKLFDDVSRSDWFYTPVKWAVDQHVTNGKSATTFAPNEICTRAQIVTFLWNAAGQPKVSGINNPFTDVKSTDWYYSAVLWAVSKKITNGTSATTFSPNKDCTRAQVVTFLWNWAGQPITTNKVSFKDVSTSAYYYYPVRWAVDQKVTNGVGDGTRFCPTDQCTRAQVVTFLYNYFKTK